MRPLPILVLVLACTALSVLSAPAHAQNSANMPLGNVLTQAPAGDLVDPVATPTLSFGDRLSWFTASLRGAVRDRITPRVAGARMAPGTRARAGLDLVLPAGSRRQGVR